MKNNRLVFSLAMVAALPAFGGSVVYSGSGANIAGITGVVSLFQGDIGGGSVPGAAGSFSGVRREINWDAVPDAKSSPNSLNANFFNTNSPRGAVFSTPGTGFEVSAKTGNPTSTPTLFDNINPTYSSSFQTFSPQRLFTSIGSNVMDVSFFLAGTGTAATTSAFGSVFTDVDLASTTTIEFFSAAGSLGVFSAPTADRGLSFLGVRFDAGERVSKVRITSGNAALSALNNDGGGVDVVAMDDFIYAEPASVPEPSTIFLGAAGLLALGIARKRS